MIMSCAMSAMACSRPSQEGRGLKLQATSWQAGWKSRPSQEGRGLKYLITSNIDYMISRPSQEGRGLKFAILARKIIMKNVVPRKRDVD